MSGEIVVLHSGEDIPDQQIEKRSQNATTNWNMRRSSPFAFTELGVSMLSSILTSEAAVQANIQIIRAFAAMRRFLVSNAQFFQRLENLEYKLIATDHNDLISKI